MRRISWNLLVIYFLKLALTASACLLFLAFPSEGATDDADSLYKAHSDSVYQIRVIEIKSGKKASAGSAFCVGTNGLLVSNYHVVNRVIGYPRLYRLECIESDGTAFPLEIVDIDVIHDLAILRSGRESMRGLRLSKTSPEKGRTLYVLGNPLDLGMVIVDGTYNGLIEKSRYEKILFSGSLNSGMSGGPAIVSNGDVIGVSVSTAGDQISFLVPVKYLTSLLSRVNSTAADKPVDLHKRIEQQLFENQKQYISRLLRGKWGLDTLGAAKLPKINDDTIQSWGGTERDAESLHDYTRTYAGSRDEIFLSPELSTGKIYYLCKWYTDKGLGTARFYNLLEDHFGRSPSSGDAEEDDVTNFETHSDFVTIAGREWRVSLSARNYKKYPSLYDLTLSMASLHSTDHALLIDVVLIGVGEEDGAAFLKFFMEAIQWEN
jgi:serine protease Do